MQVHPPSSDQRSLRDQQNDPRGENRPVDVNENVRQRSLEHTGKVVAAAKPTKTVARMMTAMPEKKKSSYRKVLLSNLDWSALVAIVF
jgi:hypothetical protein